MSQLIFDFDWQTDNIQYMFQIQRNIRSIDYKICSTAIPGEDFRYLYGLGSLCSDRETNRSHSKINLKSILLVILRLATL